MAARPPACGARRHRFAGTVAATVMATSMVAAQSSGDRFDIVSLRRVPPACPYFEWREGCTSKPIPNSTIRLLPDGSIEVTNTPLSSLISTAYDIPEARIRNAPDWVHQDMYDLIAIAGGGANPRSSRLMLRTLLEERFGLETRPGTMRVSALVVRRLDQPLSSWMRPAVRDCVSPYDRREVVTTQSLPKCPTQDVQAGRLISNVTMTELFSGLSGDVVDETGLQGRYDIVVGRNASLLSELAARDLGLELRRENRKVETLQIKRVRRPIAD